MFQEFIDFVFENNIIGVAIGMLVAAKVGSVVKSLVEDLFTPAIFSPTMKRLKIDKLEDLSFKGVLYGRLLARTIDFIITALIVFLVIRYFGIQTP